APRSARVLWVGVHSDQPLSRLAERVRPCTEGYRELTERRFHPHLTLARVPPGHQPEARRVLSRLDGYQGPEWPGRELQLISSSPGSGPGGRTSYETLETFSLDAAG